jgi:rfaE bifunctional protein kinase chain/domain
MFDEKYIELLFDNFSRRKVLIIGDVMIDAYLWGEVDRISPEAPVPVVALKKRDSRLGGAANVALNIQSLGATPYLCSVIGQDEKSKQFLSLLQERGMPAEGIISSPDRITTVKFRIIGNNAQLLRVDEENEHDLVESETLALFGRISQMIEKGLADVIIFEDYNKGVITPELIKWVVDMARTKGIPVVVDPKKKNFLHYHGVDLFKPNMKELREGLKLDGETQTMEEVSQAVALLQQKLGAGMVLTTLSDKGIYFRKLRPDGQTESGHFAAHLRQISDVSGAGDTVISIAALCMAAGAEAPFIAQLANLGGGLVCEQVGVVPINKELLRQEALQILGQ